MGEHDKRLPESAGKGSGDIDKLKKDLRDKIDQACKKKEYNEALNLIDLYMSSVGIDKDIYVLRSKIVKQKRFQDKDELQPDLEKPKKNADEVKDLSIEYDMELEAPLEEGLGETSPTMVSYVPDSEPNGGDEPLDLSTPLPSSVRRPESRNEPVERPAAVHSSLMEELSVITDQNQGQMESRKPVSSKPQKDDFGEDEHELDLGFGTSRRPASAKEKPLPPLIQPPPPEKVKPQPAAKASWMLNHEEAEPAPEKLTPLRKEPRRRGKLSVKRVVGAALVLVLGLAAAVYLLFFKKGTTSTPTDRTSPADKKAEERSQPPRPNRQPTRPPATAGTGARVPAANDPFNQYIKQAGAQIQAGELPQALLTLQLARKIKITSELVALENLISKKIWEMKAPSAEAQANSRSADDQAFAKASSENSIAALETYLKNFPQGTHALDTRRQITTLQKRQQEQTELRLQQKASAQREVRLRSSFLYFSQKDIAANLRPPLPGGSAKQEAIANSDEPVVVDYRTGLMWHQWPKPMDFDKAGWWANIRYAGYFNWRLPTLEEAASLAALFTRYFAASGNAPIEIWTGDRDSAGARQAWVMVVPNGEVHSARFSEFKYLITVRSILK